MIKICAVFNLPNTKNISIKVMHVEVLLKLTPAGDKFINIL